MALFSSPCGRLSLFVRRRRSICSPLRRCRSGHRRGGVWRFYSQFTTSLPFLPSPWFSSSFHKFVLCSKVCLLFFSYIQFKIMIEQNSQCQHYYSHELLWKISTHNPKPILSWGNLLRQSVMEVIVTMT